MRDLLAGDTADETVDLSRTLARIKTTRVRRRTNCLSK